MPNGFGILASADATLAKGFSTLATTDATFFINLLRSCFKFIEFVF
jgi:hypothetical protein